MTAIGRLLGNNPPGIHKTGDPTLVLPETYMGLEFEIENYPRNTPLGADIQNFWAIKEDHSLRNSGMEFVFNQPLFGKDITSALDAFLAWQKKTKIQTSVRTGLHVHLDVRELPVRSLVSFLMIYTSMEPLIYRWVGAAREESNFCVPFYYSDESLRGAFSIISGLMEDDSEMSKSGAHKGTARHHSERFERYSGLNLQALYRFGSVEFRQMPMIFDRERIVDWMNIILSIKKLAKSMEANEVSTLLRKHKYNINTVAQEFGFHLAKCLSNFEVPSDLKSHVCFSAEQFTKAGQVRKWSLSNSKYSGANPTLARLDRGEVNVAAPPVAPLVIPMRNEDFIGPALAPAIDAAMFNWFDAPVVAGPATGRVTVNTTRQNRMEADMARMREAMNNLRRPARPVVEPDPAEDVVRVRIPDFEN